MTPPSCEGGVEPEGHIYLHYTTALLKVKLPLDKLACLWQGLAKQRWQTPGVCHLCFSTSLNCPKLL
jgi:hypothetical protein